VLLSGNDSRGSWEAAAIVLFVGDDWAEDHVRHEALGIERR
jgi:hypothetical protein